MNRTLPKKKSVNKRDTNSYLYKKKVEVSFIMPIYNNKKYVSDSIKELQKEKKIKWELIIIDDYSTDKTFKMIKQFSKKDHRIKLFKNIKKGKVAATNYGFNLSCGKIIKCIDSDDVLSCKFFSYYDILKNYSAHCHNALITDINLNYLASYYINPLLVNKSYEYVASNLLTFPKWAWSFDRQLAKKIFPIPENLPFEDVWMNLIIKKFSKKIFHINKSIYKYRQHPNQTFGGILNYSEKKVIFRAKRILKLLSILKNETKITNGLSENIFNDIEDYYKIISKKKISYLDIMKIEKNIIFKLKVILIKKIPNLAKYATYLKWKLDGIFKN